MNKYSWKGGFYELANNEKVLKRMREEIEKNFVGEITYDSLKKNDYLDSFISEVLRLHPPVATDPKEAVEDDILPGGFPIKKGDLLVWCAWNMGRNEEYFENALSFDPERWDKISEKKGSFTTSYTPPCVPYPFQFGPSNLFLSRFTLLLEIN